MPVGEIVVIDNAGRSDATVWGDILTFVAHRRCVGGTVIDGHCRDIALSLELDYPIFSRGCGDRGGGGARSQGTSVLGQLKSGRTTLEIYRWT